MSDHKRKPSERVVVKEANDVKEFMLLVNIYLEQGVTITSTGWTATTRRAFLKYIEKKV